MNTKQKLLTLALAAGFAGAANGQVFTEDFGTLADGTEITTSNTDFTYVRTGSGGADPSVINPGNFGTGSSGFVQQANASASLTGVGIEDTLPSSNVYTFSVDFRFTDVTDGDIVFGVGSGNAFTQNGTFSTNDGLFWLQSNNGEFERRTSVWNDIGSGGTTFANGTNYSLHVVANGSGSSINYGSGSVAAGAMDIYLDGTLLDDDVAVTNSLAADGFRIYSVNGTGVEIDNVNLWNSAQAVPEPETFGAIAGVLALGLAMVRRRRRA